MKYKKWDDFKADVSAISKLITIPKNATDLTPKQAAAYAKLLLKEEKTEKEVETFNVYQRKRELAKDPPLSQTAKNYLIEKYGSMRYGKRNAAATIQKFATLKGVSLEREAIKLLSKLHKTEYRQFTEVAENDFLKGRGDCICINNENLIEIKISWNSASFFKNLVTKLPPNAWYQVQGYMELYNLPKARVCWVLVDTPRHLVDQEIAKIYYKYTYGDIQYDEFQEFLDKATALYHYDSIPLKRRVITYEVVRDQPTMERVRNAVIKARVFLSEFEVLQVENKNIITLAENYVKVYKEDHIEPDAPDSCESDPRGQDSISD